MKRKAFTLIEMSVVVAIIGILYMTVVPMYGKTIKKSKEVALQKDLYVLRKVIDGYYKDNEKWPPDLKTLVTSGYIRKIPEDPITNNSTSWIIIPSADGAKDVYNIESGAKGKTLDGKEYKDL